jgi:hypothetical protein
MDIYQADLTIVPKDCEIQGIPKLPCDEPDTSELSMPALGMAYVPAQRFRELYDLSTGFRTGTIFKELDLPFYGIGGTLL